MKKCKVGIIGVGQISTAYIKGCREFETLEIVACSDLDQERARAVASEHGIPKACSSDELLADADIDLVINLTIPTVHAEVNRRILHAGKHVYAEKPFSTDRESGRDVLELARQKGLKIACAPDTVMAEGQQTCRKLIDDGAIGTPVAATAFMMTSGLENWHPNPFFFYAPGGGPLFDMGPYYLSALINYLGPMQRVSASARINFPKRIIGSQPHAGREINVTTPTHFSGTIDFVSGAMATVIMSFDVIAKTAQPMEIYGSEGTLTVPDSNRTVGSVQLRRRGEKEWTEIPLTHAGIPHRGVGVADLAQAILDDREPRASGAMAFHVVDAMQAFEESSNNGRHIALTSSCERPNPLPAGTSRIVLGA